MNEIILQTFGFWEFLYTLEAGLDELTGVGLLLLSPETRCR